VAGEYYLCQIDEVYYPCQRTKIVVRLVPLDPRDNCRRLYAKRFAETKQKLNRRRLLASFQKAYVIARNVRLERKLFLRQSRDDPGFP
jgi:hypothetical protein